jgi:diguanylate cyclase (GGDEF)-like protein
VSRIRLRTRVTWLTVGFAAALLSITFGLSLRAKQSQERWTRLIDVELQTVAALEELIREQNSFTARAAVSDPRASERYGMIEQLLERPVLRAADLTELRSRVEGFRRRLEARPVNARLVAAAGRSVVVEGQRLIEERRGEIARQIPRLQREARSMGLVGLAVAWIVMVLAVAASRTTKDRVVEPIEALSAAAKRIGAGDADVRAPIRGDRELMELGIALNDMADKLKERARTDDLTGMPNFRAFRERIDAEIERASRYQTQFGVLVLDLDRFKNYNDTYGHLAGNDALQRVASIIREAVRAVDFPARYGGEEFAVVLPQTDISSIQFVAERIRSNVEALPAPRDGAQVTISIGGALFPLDGVNAAELFQLADERLYVAKTQGRNRVVVTTPARVVQSAG